MAHPKKVIDIPIEEKIEIIEHEKEETITEPAEEQMYAPVEKEYVYVPDIPAQMIEPAEAKETEIEFLERILCIQEDGGFGRHLHGLIRERIKSLS